MTNEQNNQVAAMCNEGMSIDEIVAATKIPETDVRDFVKSRNARKKGCITKATQQAVLNWYKMGNSEGKTATHFGLAQSTVHKIIVAAKEKEPVPEKAETSSGKKPIYNDSVINDSTLSTESQALELAKRKLLTIYETLTPEETRAWEMGEVYAEVIRGLEK